MYVPFLKINIKCPNCIKCFENTRKIICAKSRTRWMLHCTYSYISCLVTTDCMGQNSSWVAASGSACHGIQRLLWKPRFHWHINKRCQLSLLYTTPTQSKSSHPVSLRSVLIRFVHLQMVVFGGGELPKLKSSWVLFIQATVQYLFHHVCTNH